MTETGTVTKTAPGETVKDSSGKPTKLFNKNYLLLWQGQFVSRLGNQVYFLAMILWIEQSFPANAAANYVGLLGMLGGIPAVLLSAVGGAVADRYSRKKIIIISDLLNGIAILSLAALFFLMPGELNLILIGVFAANIIGGMLNSFFGPAISAAIPDIVPEERVAGANTMGQFSMQMATFFGMGVGGILLKILGAPLLVLIDGITYMISAFSESFIKIPQVFPEKVRTLSEVMRSFRKDIGEGLRYIFSNKGLRNLLFVSVFSTFFSAPITILLVFFIEHTLSVNPAYWLGPLMVAFSIGTLIGYLSVGMFRIRGETRKRLMILFMVLNSGGYIILGMARSPFIALVLIFIGGVLSGFVIVNITTLLQITTPSAIRGRVFGALTTISGSIAPLGMGLSGPVVAMVGFQNIHIIYMGCGAIMVALSLLISMNRHFRRFIAYKTKDEPEEITGFHYNIRIFDPNKIYDNNQ
jgi:MFS family permease